MLIKSRVKEAKKKIMWYCSSWAVKRSDLQKENRKIKIQADVKW